MLGRLVTGPCFHRQPGVVRDLGPNYPVRGGWQHHDLGTVSSGHRRAFATGYPQCKAVPETDPAAVIVVYRHPVGRAPLRLLSCLSVTALIPGRLNVTGLVARPPT